MKWLRLNKKNKKKNNKQQTMNYTAVMHNGENIAFSEQGFIFFLINNSNNNKKDMQK